MNMSIHLLLLLLLIINYYLRIYIFINNLLFIVLNRLL